MIQEVAEKVSESASELLSGMGTRDPFHTLTMIVIVALLAWFVYQDHALKERLVDIRLLDQKQESERVARLEKFQSIIKNIQRQNDEDRILFIDMLEAMDRRDMRHHETGTGLVQKLEEKLDARMDGIEGRLDVIINNQQLRSVIRPNLPGPQP